MLTATATTYDLKEKERTSPRDGSIADDFIYEMLDGKPVYYRGYQEAINSALSPEHVMGTGRKQFYVINLILRMFHLVLDVKKFMVGSNEPGVQISRKNWVSNDIIIIRAEDKKKLFTDKYFDFPPKIVIEVDSKAELIDFENPLDYFVEKTRKLLDFGVEKVIWIFTKSQKVWVAEPGRRNWDNLDWDETIEVLPGCNLNLLELLAEDGTTLQEFLGLPEES